MEAVCPKTPLLLPTLRWLPLLFCDRAADLIVTEFINIASLPLLPILEESSDGIGIVAPHPWRLVYANSTLARLLGGSPDALCGRTIREVFGEATADDLVEQFERLRSGKVPRVRSRHELTSADGENWPMEYRLLRIDLDGGPLVGITMRRSEVGRRRESSTDGGRQDPLTGLPDRTILMERMAALLRGERSADRQFAVLFIDLDNFKEVNDGHGHLVGDRVLSEVARRLSRCVRSGDIIVRFGGDEFVALVESVAGRPEIQPVVDRIHAALANPIVLAEGVVTLSVSVGMAEASAEHHTPEDLLRDADRAMYASKRLQA